MPCCLLPANRTEGGLNADMEILLGVDTRIGSSWFMGVLGLIGIQQRDRPSASSSHLFPHTNSVNT